MASPQWLSKLRGTMMSIFGIGGTSGVGLKNNSGALQVRNAGDSAHADLENKRTIIHGNNASNGVVLTVPDSMGSVLTYVLPDSHGTTGYFLQNNGSGTLVWAAGLSGADLSVRSTFTQATGSPLTVLDNPAANSILRRIVIEIEVAAGGGSPTLSVGIASDSDLYVDELDLDVKTAAIYVIDFEEELGATPDDIILTIVADSQTFSGDIVITYALP